MTDVVTDTQNNDENLMVRREPTPYEGQDRYDALQDDPEDPAPKEEQLPEVDEDDAEEVTFKKRYGDLRRHAAETESRLNKALEEAKAVSPKAEWVPPKTEEEMETWKTEYPEAYEVFVTIAQGQVHEASEDVSKLRDELQESKRETSKEKAIGVIRESHPDWDELRNNSEFHDWAETQPKLIQDALYDNQEDGAAVVRAIDLYKLDTGVSGNKSRDKGDMKKAAAELVSKSSKAETGGDHGGKKIWTSHEIEAMSISEYEAREDEIALAQREGRIN